MSSEAPAVAAASGALPEAVEANHTIATSAPESRFGDSVLAHKDAPSHESAVVGPDASSAAMVDTSEQNAAAVAAAAAAAAAADASSAAQTITELATAATNAANSAPSTSTDAAAVSQPPEASTADASEAALGTNGEAVEAQDAEDAAAEAEPTSGLPRNVESELRDIYSVASAIANFSVAHVNQVAIPTPQKVRTIIQKALKLTSSLSMLLAQPEVALRQLDVDEHGKRPAESKLDSARKRQRSSDWDGIKGAPGTPGPFTPSSSLRIFPDGSLPTSFPSPGFDGDAKGPQYKKRSRAPAPGSCQACGSMETPEWRRGPDGARTLCNACGLHYAKLVRKRVQQEGGEVPSPSQPPPQLSLVSLEELRASTKSAEAAAAAGLSSSSSSKSLNTPTKGDRSEAWNTPSKPPRVASSLSSSVLTANHDDVAAPPAAPENAAPPTAGIVEPVPTPAAGVAEAPAAVSDSVIAPELAGESITAIDTNLDSEDRPMETDQ